jgi:hypothetical protein
MQQHRLIAVLIGIAALVFPSTAQKTLAGRPEKHLLYVAEPGIRNYVEHGGVGVLVYDIADGHRFLKRISTFAVKPGQEPEAVKGICASPATGRLYVSTPTRLLCLDLLTEKPLWDKSYEGGCDRMSISPDGKVIYLPAFEGPHWNVVDALSGDLIRRIETKSGSHNTVYGLDGTRAYLAGLKSPVLSIADTRTHSVAATCGPFSNVIRPFTINGAQTLCFVNVNELLGFEVGELKTGRMLCRVEVAGYRPGPTKRHGCPSHGIALTPDERELWLTDAANSMLHLFDATVMPPKQLASLRLRDQPGWVTFSLDGRYAYPSTGEVIETKSRRILTTLKDEAGRPIQSEKLQEIIFADGKPVRCGDQFGLGRRVRE